MAGNSPAYGGPKSFHPDQNCNDITAYLYVKLGQVRRMYHHTALWKLQIKMFQNLI